MRIYTFLLLTLCFPLTVHSDNYSDYQLRRLLDPTISESAAEKNGKVHIYDGLSSAKVGYALNHHFERIDNMMFTQIVHIDEQGEQYVEDDGCD